VWPSAHLSWIIGRTEAQLMSLLPGIEFIIIDKRAGWRSAQRARLLP
jgi:heptosyltransferase I